MSHLAAEGFVNRLVRRPYNRSLSVFNPYRDFCEVYDQLAGTQTRSELLRSVLDAAIEWGVRDLWVGCAPGWRGARRTGLAFTDDLHVQAHCFRWRLPTDPQTLGRSTRGKPIREGSAGVVWRMLNLIDAPIFLWNVFPFHPHQPSNPFTNRALNQPEKEIGGEILEDLINLLRPIRLVAIGNDADKAVKASRSRLERHAVRHPSHGGVTEFTDGMARIYGLNSREVRPNYNSRQMSLFKED